MIVVNCHSDAILLDLQVTKPVTTLPGCLGLFGLALRLNQATLDKAPYLQTFLPRLLFLRHPRTWNLSYPTYPSYPVSLTLLSSLQLTSLSLAYQLWST